MAVDSIPGVGAVKVWEYGLNSKLLLEPWSLHDFY